MMIPQILAGALTPEPSQHSPRSYRHAASLALCVVGLLGSAPACTGEIDADTQAPLSGSVTSPGKDGTAAPGTAAGTAPRQTPAGSAADGELGNDNVQGVDGEATAPRRRGGAGRARAARDDDERDAGDDELADAGEVDAAGIDAAGLDAGAVDAGPAEDASAAAP